ncbi:hypothetical protein GGI35DRAFT_453591, partial [Trichoderma velutinum]
MVILCEACVCGVCVACTLPNSSFAVQMGVLSLFSLSLSLCLFLYRLFGTEVSYTCFCVELLLHTPESSGTCDGGAVMAVERHRLDQWCYPGKSPKCWYYWVFEYYYPILIDAFSNLGSL